MKEQILDTAFKHFVKFGYAKTTLTGIAEELGKRKSALYYYFSNKEDIFCSIVRIEAENFLMDLTSILNDKKCDVSVLLVRYINHRIRTMYGVAARYNLLKGELFTLLPLIEASRMDCHIQEVRLLSELLNKGVDSGVFKELDPELNSKVIVNTLKGLEIPMFVSQEFKVDQREIDAITSIIMNGIKK